MKYIHHSGFFNPQKRAVHYSCSCHHAQSLACKASLAKKITGVKNANDCCLPLLGGDGELHPSFLDIEDESSRISLHKDTSFRGVFDDFSSPPESSEEALRIKTRAGEFLWHGPLQSSGIFQRAENIRRGCLTAVKMYDFFFSSRRRHTRSLCDWSSDVCSSD